MRHTDTNAIIVVVFQEVSQYYLFWDVIDVHHVVGSDIAKDSTAASTKITHNAAVPADNALLRLRKVRLVILNRVYFLSSLN